MKVSLRDFVSGDVLGECALNPSVFGAEIREDILARTVRWQLACRQQGTHKTKGISDVSGTTRKPWRQKGTGRARQGSLRSPQFRGGGIIFGPVVHSHAHDLPKKVRKLALRVALSGMCQEGRLLVVKDLPRELGKTKEVASCFEKLGTPSALVLATEKDLASPLAKGIRNLASFNLLPDFALNVYDVLRHSALVLSQDALKSIEDRLS